MRLNRSRSGQVAALALGGWVATLILGAPSPARDAYGNLPLSFEPNWGQAGSEFQFLSRGRGLTLLLGSEGATLAADNTLVRMTFVGGHAELRGRGEGELPARSHYLLGRDPAAWRTNVPHYARVRFEDVYPGIDLVYYGRGGQLEYDFVVAPGADSKSIRFRFDGAAKLALEPDGDLRLGSMRFRKPFAYQEVNGARRSISARYVLKGKDQAAFEVGAYDAREPLVIDPILSYSTYLGGARGEGGFAIAVDGAGSAYITGATFSANFPVANARPSLASGDCRGFPFPCTDVFVAKLNPAGTGLVYFTYLGGGLGDIASGIAVDSTGSAYVTGLTFSTDWPTANPRQAVAGGQGDAFVAKLSPSGATLVYSTYLGGSGGDSGLDIAVDSTGHAYVTGGTDSPDFPTVNPLAPGRTGAFVSKLNPSGSALVYSTGLGGSSGSTGSGIAIDGAGNAYVTGYVSESALQAPNWPTVNAVQPAFGGWQDAFVAKINAAGSALAYSTYLGGNAEDWGTDIAVDAAGSAYVAGWTFVTRTSTFPTTPGSFQPEPGARCLGDFDCNSHGFVTKLSPAGTTLVYSTYLSGFGDRDGSVSERAAGIAVDSEGSAYVTGTARSATFPLVEPLQRDRTDAFVSSGAFVAKFGPAGSRLLFSTILSGMSTYLEGIPGVSGDFGGAAGRAIALDPQGNVYVTGDAGINFPTTNSALQTVFGGWRSGGGLFNDVFAARIDMRPAPRPLPTLTSVEPPRVAAGASAFRLTVNGNGFDRTSVVRWNGRDRPTTFLDSTRLEAAIPASDVAAPALGRVVVYTPEGGFSNSLTVLVGAPVLSSGGVVNAASFRPGVAPGSIAAIFGTGLVDPAAERPLTSVTFNGIYAHVFFWSSGQLIVQVPVELPVGTATVVVTRGGGELSSLPVTVRVDRVAPGIFAVNNRGDGPGAILHGADFRVVTAEAPAVAGEIVSVFCTGLGAVNGYFATGYSTPVRPPPETVSRPEVFIGNMPASVGYSGLAPDYVGLYQINVEVPPIAAGAHPVRVVIDGVASNTVTIAVR